MSHYDDNATISHKNETVTACKQALREKSRASGKRNETKWGGVRCGERKWELFVSSALRAFATHSRVCLPLEMEKLLSVHTFLCNRTRSVFGELVDIRNSNEKLVDVSFFTHRLLLLHGLLFWFTKEVWLSLIFVIQCKPVNTDTEETMESLVGKCPYKLSKKYTFYCSKISKKIKQNKNIIKLEVYSVQKYPFSRSLVYKNVNY